MRLKSPLPLPSSQKSRRPHKCPTSYLLQLHLVYPLSMSRPGFSQQVVRLLTAFDKLQRLWMTFFCEFTKSYHSKRLDFWWLDIYAFLSAFGFFKVSHMKVWILRTLTSMTGFVLSPGLDLSCLLVSWNKQIFGHLAVSWTRKQATHPQLSWEKAWEQQQFLEIEKAVLRYWCQ